MNKKQVTLYNMLFPIWIIPFMVPWLFLLIIPGNFIIDSLVLIAAMYFFKIENKGKFYLKSIWTIFIFGLLSDVAVAFFSFISSTVWISIGYFIYNVFHTPEWLAESFSMIPYIALTSFLIFILNYYVTFRKQEKTVRRKLSMFIAAATAPYMFLVPTSLVYSSEYTVPTVLIIIAIVITFLIIMDIVLFISDKIKNTKYKTIKP